ncbi:MAG: peptide chain release factor N(5)-glutamine methyltransferase [Acholeplasmataceae bacterium]
MTFEQLLKKASSRALKASKEKEAVKLLLMHVSSFEAHDFYMHLKDDVSKEMEVRFLSLLEAYINDDIPVQHLIGFAYFYGYPFFVNKDVLIPRSETEQLVEHVLYYYDHYFKGQHLNVLDLGTGSGCIGITLDLEEPLLNVMCTDISQEALFVAQKNSEALQSHATIKQSDLFQDITDVFDIIVSNPPYIPKDEHLDPMVLNEPHVALYGGDFGIDFYQKIITEAKAYLKPTALLAFEHGYQQSKHILDIAQQVFPDAIVIQKKDLQGKDRFTFIGIGGVLS